MDFDLSDTQKALYSSVRRFFETEAPPSRLLKIYDRDEGLDRDLWRKSADLGLAGLIVPEEHGGAGLELLDLAVVTDAMGYCAAPGPLLGHALVGMALSLGGSEEQKARWLPRLASGEVVASLAISEHGERWQPDQWTAVATAGRLTASKKNVLFAADADLFLVGLAGGGLALVEQGAPGLTVREVDGIDRTRRLGALGFVDTPCELLPEGLAVAERIRDAALVLLAADAYGGAHRSVELMTNYANERVQFGRTIGHFQGVKHQIADAAAEVEPARQLVWYAAYTFDHRPDEAPRLAALAKAHLTDRYVNTTRTMVLLHGGIGYTWEFHCQFWLKRAMFDRTFLGSPSVHRERAAAMADWQIN
ncbi:acyl-CoA dehydrogenase family protein [Phenylobacterium sp. SCN 70-31]|uniref:acyl-CoA dehydrogenase family protein n=1 Tax=Phenylobacterium sp. SCN 70-31 TaxID=1660129 RepID=UPI00086C1122|nr:acyl-CoA dehydrogenase family protein [Phenylobacterium sp. SCN 70-31]ODT88312.1 MAG: hypothetical protein ABS78_06710 [Phenylobacterium sp. SCN 70-31]